MSSNDDKYCITRRKPQESDNLILLEECGGVCPLCGKILIDKKGKIKKLFEVAHIYPNSPTLLEQAELEGVERLGENSEDNQNWIALCHDCHRKYDHQKTVDEYNKLLHRKKEMVAAGRAKHELSEKNIDDELKLAAERLANMTSDDLRELEELNYDVLKVSEKVGNAILCKMISRNVIDYYLFIREELRLREEMGSSTLSEKISMNIKHAYAICRHNKLSEEKIYDELTNWLINKIQCRREVAQIVLSFFVQNCDVYEMLS